MESKQSTFLYKVYPLLFLFIFWGMALVPCFLTIKERGLSSAAINDTFYGRDRLINLFIDLRLRIGDRVFPQVIVGKDGWLLYSDDNNLDHYQHVARPTARDTAQMLIRLNEYLESRGIKLLVVIAPNKETIYPQVVPDEIPVINDSSRLDQLIYFLREESKEGILLDLRPALINASESDQVYYRTDTHWNDLGAYVVYREIILRLSHDFPDLQPHSLNDFEYQSVGPKRRDLVNILGSGLIFEEDYILQPKFNTQTKYVNINMENKRPVIFAANPNETLPRALVYRDSFFSRLLPLVGEHFSDAIYIWDFPGSDVFTWIEYEKPDVVIIEIVERNFLFLPEFSGNVPAP